MMVYRKHSKIDYTISEHCAFELIIVNITAKIGLIISIPYRQSLGQSVV